MSSHYQRYYWHIIYSSHSTYSKDWIENYMNYLTHSCTLCKWFKCTIYICVCVCVRAGIELMRIWKGKNGNCNGNISDGDWIEHYFSFDILSMPLTVSNHNFDFITQDSQKQEQKLKLIGKVWFCLSFTKKCMQMMARFNNYNYQNTFINKKKLKENQLLLIIMP